MDPTAVHLGLVFGAVSLVSFCPWMNVLGLVLCGRDWESSLLPMFFLDNRPDYTFQTPLQLGTAVWLNTEC